MSAKEWVSREAYNEYMRGYHNQRRAEYRDRLRKIKESSGGCIKCGESDWRCLDYHHRDPSQKVANISSLVGRASWTWERVLEEIAKCDLLCANCHRKEEIEECIRMDEELPC